MDALITAAVAAAVIVVVGVLIALAVGFLRRRRTRELQQDFAAAYDREFDRSPGAFPEPGDTDGDDLSGS